MAPPSSPSPRDLEKVRALVALAVSPSAGEHEAAAAAMQAVRRIHELDLLGLDQIARARLDARTEMDNLAREERHAEARAEAAGQRARARETTLVRIDAMLLVLSESPLAYRFARLGPSFRTVGIPVVGWVRKNLVAQVVWASEATAKPYLSTGRRVAEALLVPEEWAGRVEAILKGSER